MSSSLLSKAGLHCSSACSRITEPILAAAIGTREDVENFLRLGSPGYAWTVLFFAVSHDNVNTFRAIVEHSGGDGIFRILDGDGWTLLQGAVYFGAPRVTRMVLSNGGVDVNQRTLPAPLPEDPELLDRELTASDIVIYIDQDRCGIFMDSLTDTGRDGELGDDEVFWDADDGDDGDGDGEGPIYGTEDVDARWTLLHWASYNGSPKIKRLLLLKGVDPKHLDAIKLKDNPALLPVSPFEAAVLMALVWGRLRIFGSWRRR